MDRERERSRPWRGAWVPKRRGCLGFRWFEERGQNYHKANPEKEQRQTLKKVEPGRRAINQDQLLEFEKSKHNSCHKMCAF